MTEEWREERGEGRKEGGRGEGHVACDAQHAEDETHPRAQNDCNQNRNEPIV